MQKMTKNIIILDGYNVIHRIPELQQFLNQDLATARTQLFRFCSNWLATRRDFGLFYIVFDGQSGVVGNDYQPGAGIRTVYTNTGETADTRILTMIEELSSTATITVVSDDNFVRTHSHALDAIIMSASDFFATPTANRSARQQNHANEKKLTPKQIKDINASLKDEWNIE
jgi:predicted RNA-binding protein with PIN domain